jgi:hypothetical protein
MSVYDVWNTIDIEEDADLSRGVVEESWRAVCILLKLWRGVSSI